MSPRTRKTITAQDQLFVVAIWWPRLKVQQYQAFGSLFASGTVKHDVFVRFDFFRSFLYLDFLTKP